MNTSRLVALASRVAALVLTCFAPFVPAQTVDPAYSGTYSLVDLGPVTGLPTSYGGLILKSGDPNTLIIGGAANTGAGRFYSVPVTRGAGGHITALGTATQLGYGVNNDGGVAYGPGGVLFYSEYSINNVGQVKPGSIADDKTVALGPLGIASSTGALNFVPAGYMGAGKFKISSWSGGQFYDVAYSADGSGTYNLTSAALVTTLPGGPEGFIYVPLGSLLFPSQSMLVSEYSAGNVVAYTIDANGDPVIASRKVFISGLTGAEGAAIDPITGDFLFSTFGAANHVIEVRGFVVPNADLAITKTDTPDPVAPGQSLTYTLTITNNGPGAAQNAVLTDTVPTGTGFSSLTFVSGTNGTCTTPPIPQPGTVTCNFASLPASQSTIYTLTVTVLPGFTGTISNTANVTSATNDPTPGNNSATATTTVSPVVSSMPTLTKSFSPTTIVSGGTTTLTFTLTNPAPNNPLQTVSFVDTLPAGLQIAAVPNVQNTCAGVTGTANPGGTTVTVTSATVLASTATPSTCTMSVDITNVPGQIGTCPNASFTNAAGNISNTVNLINGVTGGSCVTVNPLPSQTPSLTKAFSPTTINTGATSTLTFTVTNPAANPSQVVSFTDTLPTGLQIAATPNVGGTCTGGTVTATAGTGVITVSGRTVPAGGAGAVTCTVTVDVTNAAGQLNASCGSNPAAFTNATANISGLSNLTSAVTSSCLVVNGNTFAILKTASASSLMFGNPLTYTITVTNNGPAPANGSLLTDPAVSGFTPSSITCTNATNGAACPAAANVTIGNLQGAGITLPTFPANGTITFQLAGTFTQLVGNVVNVATITSPPGVPVQSQSSSVTVTAQAAPASNIPTLGEYALLALTLLLSIAGVTAARRMRR